MAQVTVDFALQMLRHAKDDEHSPLTIWEEEQLARAFLRAEYCKAEVERLTRELDEARAEVERLRSTIEGLWESLREVESVRDEFAQCCTRRGARMQIMRDWMSEFPAYSQLYATMWDQFAAVKDALPWFDEDGVPK